MCRNKGGVILRDAEASTHRHAVPQHEPDDRRPLEEANEVILDDRSRRELQWGALQDRASRALTLPNGNKLRYHNLRKERSGRARRPVGLQRKAQMMKRLYGAKVVENECQSLAFLHIAEVAMRVKKMTDGQLLPCHQIHDELLYCVPEKIGEQVKTSGRRRDVEITGVAARCPSGGGGHIGETYGDTK